MAQAQQILESILSPITTPLMNATNDTQSSQSTVPIAFPTDISSLLALLFSSSFGDWTKLAILGAVVEFARRSWASLWSTFVASFFITAYFEGDDDAYDWMMVWLSKKNTWKKARELQVSTRNWTSQNRHMSADDDNVIIDENQSGSSKGRQLNFLPSFGSTSTLFFNGHLLRVSRDRKQMAVGGYGDQTMETLSLSILGRDHSVLRNLLFEAQAQHKAQEANRVSVYIADNYNNWRWSGSRPKRPLSSIILDQGVKETLIEDAQDFLASEDWYAARGIPFRRGYLLHGAPGSGKTSLIHAVAGALNLDIYVISLSRRGLDDTTLNELICDLPARSIALMEDIDAAFTHGVSRNNDDDQDSNKDSNKNGSSGGMDTGHGVTLSGLLGAIDGVAAQEGRILFATTNRYGILDPALIRPGRLDLHIEFQLATSWQAGEIFKCFYPAEEDDGSNPQATEENVAPDCEIDDEKDSSTLSKRHALPKMSVKQRDALAAEFAAGVPDRLTSMASIQGHLMNFKTRPHQAVLHVKEFVDAQTKVKETKEKEREKAAAAVLKAAAVAKDTTGGVVEDKSPSTTAVAAAAT